MNQEEIIKMKQELLFKVFEITFLENDHHCYALATTNLEMINRLGGDKKDIEFDNMEWLEFYDFNHAKWQIISVKNILNVTEFDILI